MENYDAQILAVRKCAVPTFSYTEKEAYVMMSFNVIKSERIDLKYLTAVLNSKLVAFWLKNKGKMQGQNYQLDKEPLLDIPIFKTIESEQQPFITLVDKILAAKKAGEDTSAWEREIDARVFDLYNLTEAEILLILQENKTVSEAERRDIQTHFRQLQRTKKC